MKSVQRFAERPCLDDLSGEYLLDLILADAAPPQEVPESLLLDAVIEKTVAKHKKKLSKKESKRQQRKALKSAREDKKIAFLLEGDRIQEVKRCKRWEESLKRAARWALALRNNDLLSRGGGGSGGASGFAPVNISVWCSICKRSHP